MVADLRALRGVPVWAVCVLVCGSALADPVVQLPEISIIGSGQAQPPSAASEMTFSQDEIASQPAARPGEVLERTPGLIVTQHSGEGKANQYFLRGSISTTARIWRSPSTACR